MRGIRDGGSYCCDGLSHLIDFRVRDGERELGVGEPGADEPGADEPGADEPGADERPSVLKCEREAPLKFDARVAALLAEAPREDIRRLPLDQKPYWHVERARVGNSRQVPVELIVNGESVETKLVEADGAPREVEFAYRPKASCWVALRIFPSAHTNPTASRSAPTGRAPSGASTRSMSVRRRSLPRSATASGPRPKRLMKRHARPIGPCWRNAGRSKPVW